MHTSKDVPCKGIGAWLKTQIVRLASTLIPTKVCTIQPRYDILYISGYAEVLQGGTISMPMGRHVDNL
jgi:hypothetical protein